MRLLRQGKVKDIYEIEDGNILFHFTDRVSAFDVKMSTPIPRKGEVLCKFGQFWFDNLGIKHHMLEVRGKDRMVVRRLKMLPVECVVRGYLVGSGWKDYLRTGSVCGHKLPENLLESAKLPEAIFTPSTKAEVGHDENITEDQVRDLIGEEKTALLRDTSLRLYTEAHEYARQRGIIIADTKFEFGLDKNGELLLIDEVLTPDSSRFWPADEYQAGRSQPSFDKQFVRDYLETLDWDKKPPAPAIPPEIAAATTARYLEAYRLLTGKEL